MKESDRSMYALVAITLHSERPLLIEQDKLSPVVEATIDKIALALAERFELNNPSFDKGLFLCACGVKSHD